MNKTSKVTVVLGASPNPARYSNLAVHSLKSRGHQIFPIGIRDGEIDGVKIIKQRPSIEQVDTITLYLNKQRQKEYYDYIFSLHPARIIFNPGAENDELKKLAEEKGIEAIEACTLVMLATGQY